MNFLGRTALAVLAFIVVTTAVTAGLILGAERLMPEVEVPRAVFAFCGAVIGSVAILFIMGERNYKRW